METTEYLLKLSRELEEKLDEARAIVLRIEDLPVRMSYRRDSVFVEMVAASGGRDQEAWKVCTEIIGLRNQLKSLIGEARTEAEVLTSVADDVIGKTGRLV